MLFDSKSIATMSLCEINRLSRRRDLHVHVYEHATPLGADVDRYCLGRGKDVYTDSYTFAHPALIPMLSSK